MEMEDDDQYNFFGTIHMGSFLFLCFELGGFYAINIFLYHI